MDPGWPWDGLAEPELPLGDFCGGNGDSLPLLPWLGLLLGLVLGLPPELDGDEGGEDVLGGWGDDGDCEVTAQPARAAAQAAAIRSWVQCCRRMDSSLRERAASGCSPALLDQ